MYRIVFDPRYSKFIVQLLSMGGWFWVTCKDGNKTAWRFDNYALAEKWVKDLGIDTAYVQQNAPRCLYVNA